MLTQRLFSVGAVLALSATGSLRAAPEAAPPLNVLMEGLPHPSLDTQGHALKNFTFTQGHGTYTLTGKAAYLRAGGQIIGFHFTGEGTLRYTTEYALEFPEFQNELEMHCDTKAERNGNSLSVNRRVNDAIFTFAGTPVPELPAASAQVKPRDYASIQNYFERDDQSLDNRAQSLALRLLKSTDRPYFRAQFFHGINPVAFLHIVDDLDSERLTMHRVEWGHDFVYPWLQVSRQMKGWDYRVPRNPRFLLTAVDLDLDLVHETQGTLVAKETFLPTVDGLQALDLDLESYTVGITGGGKAEKQDIKVLSIKDAQGKPLAFDHRNHRLLVQTPNLQSQVPVTLTFELSGGFAPRRSGRKSPWKINGTWFPVPDERSARTYVVHAKVRAPQDDQPIMGGETLQRTQESGRVLLETRLEHPTHTFQVVGGPWDIAEKRCEGVLVRLAGTKLSKVSQDTFFAKITRNLQFFQTNLGPFPFKELNHCLDIATEPGPGLLGRASWSSLMNPTSPSVGYTQTMASLQGQEYTYPLAQQYWGQAVQNWSPEDSWVTSGLAAYQASLYNITLPHDPEGWYRNAVTGLQDWALQQGQTMGHRLAILPLPLSRFDQGLRGELLFLNIQKQIGDKDFFTFLRAFYQSMLWKPAMGTQIPFFIQKMTGKDITPLMDSACWGNEVPPDFDHVPSWKSAQETK